MNYTCCVCGEEITSNSGGRDIICPMCTQRFCENKVKGFDGESISVKEWWKLIENRRENPPKMVVVARTTTGEGLGKGSDGATPRKARKKGEKGTRVPLKRTVMHFISRSGIITGTLNE